MQNSSGDTILVWTGVTSIPPLTVPAAVRTNENAHETRKRPGIINSRDYTCCVISICLCKSKYLKINATKYFGLNLTHSFNEYDNMFSFWCENSFIRNDEYFASRNEHILFKTKWISFHWKRPSRYISGLQPVSTYFCMVQTNFHIQYNPSKSCYFDILTWERERDPGLLTLIFFDRLSLIHGAAILHVPIWRSKLG